MILLKWGKFYGVIREPGLYFISNCGIEKCAVTPAWLPAVARRRAARKKACAAAPR